MMEKLDQSEKTEIQYSDEHDNVTQEKRTLKFKNLTGRQKSILLSAGGGIAGISLGTLGVILMGNAQTDSVGDPVMPESMSSGQYDVDVVIHTHAPFSETVSDQMSFSEAFGTAREEIGPGGFFEWHGQTYNTYFKEEWDGMTGVEKNEFFASIDYNHSKSVINDEHQILDILNDLTDDIPSLDAGDHEDIVILDDEDAFADVDVDDDIVIIDDDNDLADLVELEEDDPGFSFFDDDPDILQTDDDLDLNDLG